MHYQREFCFACGIGNLEKVRDLHENHGFDIQQNNGDDDTGLVIASRNGHLDIVKYLHKYGGCDLDEKDNIGWNALIYASRYGNLNVVKYLHKHGCNLNESWNALLYTSVNTHLHVVKYLVMEGCDIQAQKNNGKNAVTLAIEQRNYQIAIFLLEYGCPWQNNMLQEICRNSQNALKNGIENYINKMNFLHNTMKQIWPDVDLLIIDLISNFTNGLENLKIAKIYSNCFFLDVGSYFSF
jgi:ankyrin repeat protein